MSDKAYVGIEFGDLELRVVYIVDSEAQELPLPMDVSSPQILFDPYSETSNIGVGFPTVSQKVGTHMSFTHISLKMGQEFRASRLEQSIETPESMLTQALATIGQNVLKVTGRPIGGTTIAVPAMMRQNGRKALIDCANDAGLVEVNLIDRCTAAALSYHSSGDSKSTTALVYDLGYGNCEYALLRLAGERCRVMNSGAVSEVSGEAIDALLMEAIVLALRKKKIYLGLKHFTPFQWQELRYIVVDARNAIAEKEEAHITLVPKLTGLDKTIKLRYASGSFKARLAPLINKTVDGIQGMLEQNALELADIDTVLLVGSSAGKSPIYNMLSEALESKSSRTEPTIIADGAAWHANQLGKRSAERLEVEPKLPARIDESSTETAYVSLSAEDSEAETGFVMEVEEESDSEAQSQPKQIQTLVINPDISLDIARKLIEQNRKEEATILLDNMGREIEVLRLTLEQDAQHDVSQMLIEQAFGLVESDSDRLRAVELTHRAHRQAPHDPKVFEGMLKVHARAALLMSTPEEYEASVRTLLCALNHDQANRSIRQALAERYYIHAVVSRKLNDAAEVFEIVDKALGFDAKHVGLNQLHKELAAEISSSKSVPETSESN